MDPQGQLWKLSWSDDLTSRNPQKSLELVRRWDWNWHRYYLRSTILVLHSDPHPKPLENATHFTGTWWNMHKFNLVGIITQDISGYCQALAHHLYPIHPNSNLTILADGLWRRMSQQAKIVSSQRTPVELFDYLALTAESIWNTWSVCPVSSSSRIKRPVPPGSL